MDNELIKEAYIKIFGEVIFHHIKKGIDEHGWYSNERNDQWLPVGPDTLHKLDFSVDKKELRPKSLATKTNDFTQDDIRYIMSLPDNSVTDAETLRKIGLITTAQESYLFGLKIDGIERKVKQGFEFGCLYPHVMKSFDIQPEGMDYEFAKKIVENFETAKNRALVVKTTCISCKEKVILPLKNSNLEDGIVDPKKQDEGMWDDGTVAKISFGYGSAHDMKTYYVGICDNCLTEAEKNGHVINLRNI